MAPVPGFKEDSSPAARLRRAVWRLCLLSLSLAAAAAVSFPVWRPAYHAWRADTHALRAAEAAAREQWTEAALLARNALRHVPRHPAAWRTLAQAEHARRSPDASACLRVATALADYPADGVMLTVSVLEAERRPDLAGAFALAALRRHPDRPEFMVLNARLARQEGNLAAARVFLDEARRRAPADEPAQLELALCDLASPDPGLRAAARERLDSLARSSRVQTNALHGLALHLTRERSPDASAAWQRLLTLAPAEPTALAFLATLNPARPLTHDSATTDPAAWRTVADTLGPESVLTRLSELPQRATRPLPSPLALLEIELFARQREWTQVTRLATVLLLRSDLPREHQILARLWQLVAAAADQRPREHDALLQPLLALVRQQPAEALLAAEWLERAGWPEEADPFLPLARLATEPGPRAAALRLSATRAAARREVDQAESFARELIDLDPADPTGRLLLAAALLESADTAAEGEHRARQLTRELPDWLPARVLLLQGLVKRRAVQDIRPELERLASTLPDPAPAALLFVLAEAACLTGDTARANRWLTDLAARPLTPEQTARLESLQTQRASPGPELVR